MTALHDITNLHPTCNGLFQDRHDCGNSVDCVIALVEHLWTVRGKIGMNSIMATNAIIATLQLEGEKIIINCFILYVFPWKLYHECVRLAQLAAGQKIRHVLNATSHLGQVGIVIFCRPSTGIETKFYLLLYRYIIHVDMIVVNKRETLSRPASHSIGRLIMSIEIYFITGCSGSTHPLPKYKLTSLQGVLDPPPPKKCKHV